MTTSSPTSGTAANDDCWNRALACSPCNNDKGNNPDLDRVFDMALESERIPSAATRDMVRDWFHKRHEWAQERYDGLPKQTRIPQLAVN